MMLTLAAIGCSISTVIAQEHFLGQGVMCGEVTDTTALLQTRLTSRMDLDAGGDLPGVAGTLRIDWSTDAEFKTFNSSSTLDANATNDFIVRCEATGLQSGTRYHYRVVDLSFETEAVFRLTGTFQTLPGQDAEEPIQFLVCSCMNYQKFMHGKEAKASGPVSATERDKLLGYPVLVPMRSQTPAFFVATGDIVYYDNPRRVAKTLPELRKCWHEQFRFPRLVQFLGETPGYWSKDDHDFRFNDSDLDRDKLPLPPTGIRVFREQLPIVPTNAESQPTYRTHRITKDLQIWLTEGRDYRSANRMKDGPGKTLWGDEQKRWLQETLLASDAKWKVLISPTPLVGPDDAYKRDNHANLKGFRHEANAFFDWLIHNDLNDLITICGDRHWQYHSVHPSGVHEFACGAMNDENSRNGVPPGDPKGTDPEALIVQPYISPEPSGGFLSVTAADQLTFDFFNDEGERLYQFQR